MLRSISIDDDFLERRSLVAFATGLDCFSGFECFHSLGITFWVTWWRQVGHGIAFWIGSRLWLAWLVEGYRREHSSSIWFRNCCNKKLPGDSLLSPSFPFISNPFPWFMLPHHPSSIPPPFPFTPTLPPFQNKIEWRPKKNNSERDKKKRNCQPIWGKDHRTQVSQPRS